MIGSSEETAEMDVELAEAWKRRPNGGVSIWGRAEDLYWITIKDSEEGKSFSELTPHNAFILIQKFINPIKNSVYRNNDGSFSAQIPKSETEIVYKINKFGSIPITIERNKYKNRSRGKTYHRDLKFMPVEEIKEAINSDPRNEINVIEIEKRTAYNKNNNQQEETGEIKITFDSENRPSEVVVDYLLLEVTQFIPRPPMCRKCFKLGQHITNDCKFPDQLCGWCGKTQHTEGEGKCDTNEQGKCQREPECRNCSANHPSWSKECSEKLFLEEVFEVKETLKTSIGRAKKIINDRRKSVNKNKEVYGESKLNELLQKANESFEKKLAEKETEYVQKLSEELATTEQKWVERYNAEVEKVKQFYERKMEQRENSLLSAIAGLTEQIKSQSANIANLTRMYWDVANKCGITGDTLLTASPPDQYHPPTMFTTPSRAYIENLQDYGNVKANSDSERGETNNSVEEMEEEEVEEKTGKHKRSKMSKDTNRIKRLQKNPDSGIVTIQKADDKTEHTKTHQQLNQGNLGQCQGNIQT